MTQVLFTVCVCVCVCVVSSDSSVVCGGVVTQVLFVCVWWSSDSSVVYCVCVW